MAGFQMRPRPSPGAVARAIREGLIRASGRGARCLLTPEMILTGYHNRFSQSDRDQAIREILAPACRETGLTLFLGNGNKISPTGRAYPRPRMELSVLGPQGRIQGAHHKILTTHGDHKAFTSGRMTDLKIRRLEGIPYGLTICNDFWATPGYTRGLAPNLPWTWAGKGARVIFHAIASGWGESYLGFHSRAMQDAAARNKIWVVAANTAYGRHAVNAPSGIVGPDGRWRMRAPARGEGLYVGALTF